MRLDVLFQEHEELTDQPLVRQTGRGGHEQLPLEQLAGPAVGWKRLVVAIGEDDARRHVFHPGEKSSPSPR